MKQVILLKGLPASGKSTWAKQQLAKHPGRFKRVSKDDLRAMLDDGKWSKGNEKFILATRDQLILAALESGFSVLVDDTNLAPKHEPHIRALVQGKAEVTIQDFTDVPLQTCLERDRQRPNYVGERVIRRMHRDYLTPKLLVVEFNADL
jgi:predicted kinase